MLLISAVIAGGLTDALTHFVAKYPLDSREALARSALLMTLATLPTVGIVWLLGPALTSGHEELRPLVTAIAVSAIPAGFVLLLRARSAALRQWRLLSLEASSSTILKVVALTLLWQLDLVSVAVGAFILAAESWIGVLLYLPDLFRRSSQPRPRTHRIGYRDLLVFSLVGWPGIVAAGVLGQAAQLVITPLGSAAVLGDFVVALTVAGLVSRVALSMRSVVFAVESATTDFGRVAQGARLSFMLTLIVAIMAAIMAPSVLPILIGDGFQGSVIATQIMLVFVALNGAGSVATAGLVAHGRPHLRSIAVIIGAVVYLALLFLLVPAMGTLGAAIATLAQALPGIIAIFFVNRYFGVPIKNFYVVHKSDIVSLIRRIRPTQR
tara:strand:- start:331 stop:1473 length:1143 start_codon:yes stop_codon:yes gene_type:complete